MSTDEEVGTQAFIERALDADGRWPILVLRHERRLHVMDGFHRLWKAQHLGRPDIGARVVPVKDLLGLPQKT